MIVALVALFVALSGVAVAANGGSFILGHANRASMPTALSAPVAGGTALQVTNNNTSSLASTALGLNVAAGHAPFTVNSGVKVANLNADMVDGIDSSAFQSRVTGSCSGKGAISQINADGTVGCGNGLRAYGYIDGLGTPAIDTTRSSSGIVSVSLVSGVYCVIVDPAIDLSKAIAFVTPANISGAIVSARASACSNGVETGIQVNFVNNAGTKIQGDFQIFVL
jgi:hypothetical protein